MAPWSTRAHPSNQPDSSSTASNTASPARPRVPPRITEADILENAYGIPTLAPSTSSSRPSRRNHGRSLSHPFPSLFNGKKKHQEENTNGFESTDEDAVSPAQARQITQNP